MIHEAASPAGDAFLVSIISNKSQGCQWGSSLKNQRPIREKVTKTGDICCAIVTIAPNFAKKLCRLEFSATGPEAGAVFLAETVHSNLDRCCVQGTVSPAPQTATEILVAKVGQPGQAAILPQEPDIRQRHAVEGVIFAGGVDGHISKHQPLARGQRGVEAVIAHHIPCQAGGAAQPHGAGAFRRVSGRPAGADGRASR